MNCKAAGIIIYKIQDGQVKFLGLKALPIFQKRSNGIYDIPKGQRDPGERPIDCAKRECYEESNLSPHNLLAGPFKCEGVWYWIAESNETPMLKNNPKTNLPEHLDWAWLSPDEMIKNCLDYLTKSISWARDEIMQHLLNAKK